MVRFSQIVLLLLVANISACLSRQPKQEVNLRKPAQVDDVQLRCEYFFTGLEPSNGPSIEALDEFFNKHYGSTIIPDNVIAQFDFSFGEELAKRLKKGDPSAKVLLRFGFTLQDDKLMPPATISELIYNINKEILAAARRIGLSENDIILPAFIFSDHPELGRNHLFRPGLDRVPKDYKPKEQNIFLEDTQFIDSAVADGRMPLDPYLLYHDIFHFVDFVASPEYMRDFRKYGREFRKHRFAGNFKDGKMFQKIYNLELMINEFIHLPRHDQKLWLENFFARDAGLEISLSETRQKYQALPLQRLISMAKAILDNPYNFFKSHGGGAREDATHRVVMGQQFQRRELINQVRMAPFAVAAFGSAQMVRPSREDARGFLFLNEDIPMYLYFLEEIVANLEHPRWLPGNRKMATLMFEMVRSFKNEFTSSQMREGLEYVLRQTLAIIEYRIFVGLKYGVTPDQMIRDLTKLINSREQFLASPSYLYFSKISASSPEIAHVWTEIP